MSPKKDFPKNAAPKSYPKYFELIVIYIYIYHIYIYIYKDIYKPKTLGCHLKLPEDWEQLLRDEAPELQSREAAQKFKVPQLLGRER